MKFFCEYCGNRIDAERDHKCPHCGASYKKNKSVQSYAHFYFVLIVKVVIKFIIIKLSTYNCF